jgi:hypothetical protein
MDDSFTLGQGAKGPHGDPPPKHAGSRRIAGGSSFGRTRMIWVAILIVVILLVVGTFLKFMGNAGQEIGSDNQTIVEQVDAAADMQAELTANQSIRSAMQLLAESGSFAAVTAEALGAAEPSFTYVTGASGDPKTVSVTATASGVGLAVKSTSGSCMYAFVQASGTTYGTGPVCTGDAATSATDASWPSG